MRQDIKNLLEEMNPDATTPVIANRIDHFLSDAMREKTVSLYEGYLLNSEILRLKRCYGNWNNSVQISTCIMILNQRLLADFFRNEPAIDTFRNWGLEAYALNHEIRKHYILDKYPLLMEPEVPRELLEHLYQVRLNCENMSFDEGPFHDERFPWEDYSPEELLLNGTNHLDYMVLSEDISDLIVEISVNY